jgi:hypothetical protein
MGSIRNTSRGSRRWWRIRIRIGSGLGGIGLEVEQVPSLRQRFVDGGHRPVDVSVDEFNVLRMGGRVLAD